MSTPILIPEHCPICAALQHAVDNPKLGQRQEDKTALRKHKRRHLYGFYTALCTTCEELLGQLERWRELSDDQVLKVHREYEAHRDIAHHRSGLVQDLFPGAQVTTGRQS